MKQDTNSEFKHQLQDIRGIFRAKHIDIGGSEHYGERPLLSDHQTCERYLKNKKIKVIVFSVLGGILGIATSIYFCCKIEKSKKETKQGDLTDVGDQVDVKDDWGNIMREARELEVVDRDQNPEDWKKPDYIMEDAGEVERKREELFLYENNLIQLIIKTAAGKIVKVELPKDDFVLSVKALIEVHEGIACRNQKLIYDGRKLLDNKTLSSYKITSGCNIRMVEKVTKIESSSGSDEGK